MRCGTNFLLTVMVMTIVVYSFVGRPSLPWLIASRILLIPLIAGLAYEVIRFSARHMDKRWVRIVMRPGLALQQLTTREPDARPARGRDHVSLRAVMTAEQLAEVEARTSTVPTVMTPAFRGAL